MEIVRPEALATPDVIKPGGEAAEAGPGGKAFGEVLSDMDGSKIRIHSPEEPRLRAENELKVQRLTEEKTRIAKTPEGIHKLGAEIERGTARMNELLDQLKGGRTFSPQELLGIQAEMHDITLQVEVTTRVVGEAVSGVRQLMQQQA